MAASADRTTVTGTTGMRASIWWSCLRTSRPDWSGRRRSRRMTSRACSAQAELMGFDGIYGAFWIGRFLLALICLWEGEDAGGLFC